MTKGQNILIKIIFPIVFIVLLLVPIISCSNPGPAATQPEPETPSATTPSSQNGQPPSSPEIQGNWLADGMVGDGEYAETQSFDDFELWWNIDEQYIYIAMKAKTTGWVAMALSSGPAMKDADMVMGFVQDGTVTVIDEYSTGNFGPHRSDSELGGSDDILESAGSEEGGYTIIEFKRKLDTGDTYDNAFSQGENSILWAYGQDDQPEQKHSTRGHGELIL